MCVNCNKINRSEITNTFGYDQFDGIEFYDLIRSKLIPEVVVFCIESIGNVGISNLFLCVNLLLSYLHGCVSNIFETLNLVFKGSQPDPDDGGIAGLRSFVVCRG